MAPSVSQQGQRLLGWGKIPGHGISEKRHFPSSYYRSPRDRARREFVHPPISPTIYVLPC